MITLYGVARSRATRPLWMLNEIGCEFTHVPVIQSYRLPDHTAPDAPMNTASPAYLAVNPIGQVPALDDDGLVLTESLAICLHLARRHGGALGPADWREDAEMMNWALFAASAIEGTAIRILYTFMDGAQDTDAGRATIAEAAETLQRPIARLEAHLAGRDWMVGGRFTVADLMLAECLRYGTMHKPLLDAAPRVAAWLARCQARDGYKKMMAARLAEPA
jgi:glutathione S-transferase